MPWPKITEQVNAESGLETGFPDLQAMLAPQPRAETSEPRPPPLLLWVRARAGRAVSQPN